MHDGQILTLIKFPPKRPGSKPRRVGALPRRLPKRPPGDAARAVVVVVADRRLERFYQHASGEDLSNTLEYSQRIALTT